MRFSLNTQSSNTQRLWTSQAQSAVPEDKNRSQEVLYGSLNALQDNVREVLLFSTSLVLLSFNLLERQANSESDACMTSGGNT